MDKSELYPTHDENRVKLILGDDLKNRKYRLKSWEKANKRKVGAIRAVHREPIKLVQRQTKIDRLNVQMVKILAEATRIVLEKQRDEERKFQALLKQADNSGIKLIVKKAIIKNNSRRRKR